MLCYMLVYTIVFDLSVRIVEIFYEFVGIIVISCERSKIRM